MYIVNILFMAYYSFCITGGIFTYLKIIKIFSKFSSRSFMVLKWTFEIFVDGVRVKIF